MSKHMTGNIASDFEINCSISSVGNQLTSCIENSTFDDISKFSSKDSIPTSSFPVMDDSKDDSTIQTLSKRGRYTFEINDFLVTYLERCLSNPYHPEENPKGIINLGASVNRLMEKEIEERLSRNDVLSFQSNNHQHYYDFQGKFTTRETLANFFNRYFSVANPIHPDDLVIMAGTASCLDSLSYALFDPGDVFLTPTPTYARIYTDFNNRSLAVPMPLELISEVNSEGCTFSLSASLLEKRILELKTRKLSVKGFVLINPQNPLGDAYPRDLLLSLLKVCAKYKLHVVIDEVYALSILNPEGKVSSILSINEVPDPERTHFVWALSKDFGLAGMRFGVVHSKNKELIKILKDIAIYCSPSTLIQDMATQLLNDYEWLENIYFPLNRSRLNERYNTTKTQLEQYNIQVKPAQAGLFVWLNLREFLREKTSEGVKDLFEELITHGLYIVPGTEFYCNEPGWFRLVFAVCKEELQIGLSRLERVIEMRKKDRESS